MKHRTSHENAPFVEEIEASILKKNGECCPATDLCKSPSEARLFGVEATFLRLEVRLLRLLQNNYAQLFWAFA